MSLSLQAFSEVDFNYVRSADSVWKDTPFEVAGLNKKVLDQIITELFRQTRTEADRAIGEVVVGTGGTGKTHLVGRLRQRVWERGGWFVLLDIVGLQDFWKTTALCFAHALAQQMSDSRTQGQAVLFGIAKKLGIEYQLGAELTNPELSLENIDLINQELSKFDRAKAQRHGEVLRALYLFCSDDFEASNLAYVWLQGLEAEAEKARALGFVTLQKHPVQLVEGLSWIMSLSGPTLVAVDQVDALIGPQPRTLSDFDLGDEPSLADILGAGLMDLHNVRARGMTVVTCLEATWASLLQKFTGPQRERFSSPRLLSPVLSNDLIKDLITARLAPAYKTLGEPARAYPFTDEAIASAAGLLPRQILIRCEEHRRRCVDADHLSECESLDGGGTVVTEPQPPGPVSPFDEGFEGAKRAASLDGLFDAANDDAVGDLISDALDLYAVQSAVPGVVHISNEGDAGQKKPRLHGRLILTYLEHKDDQRTVAFRAIEHTHWNAFQSRLGAATTAAGMDSRRSLFIVRRAPMPSTPRMAQLVEAFRRAGGQVIAPTDDDLKSFVALRSMRKKAVDDLMEAKFESWLRDRAPLCATKFFKEAGLCPVPKHWDDPMDPTDEPPEVTTVDVPPPPSDGPETVVEETPIVAPPTVPPAPDAIPIGHRLTADAEPLSLPIAVLPRHTAIIAGAGSGKTVLLRRLVEEAALAGIPAIVIDPNNDLARLGDAWPKEPLAFTTEDHAKAARYKGDVEVVVWTPGIQAGNPLFLSVMPDFAAIGDDPDERGQAITMAAETLGPLADAKTTLKKGVLSDVLRHFAGSGGGTLKDMIALLGDLPEGVSDIGNAAKIAARMADELKAAVATNPLLKAAGAVLDPKLLFFSPHPGKTRISVLNLSGLASSAAKEDFVNRLQMTLFGWIKKHPSPKGMLYVIDEAQTFLPSGAGALSKTSGVQLVAQARKYGLGMIVVTQAPKGIDNKVISNCTTQFLGKQNSPADQQTVRDMVAATGGKADDIGKLKTGEFYFKTEGSGKPVKIGTPICLTWHPANPPTPEEVVARAKASAP